GVGWRARLRDGAHVAEQGGRLVENDGPTRRPGEAGEPSQSLGRRGQEFVLVFVAMRHEEALELPRPHLALQRLDPLAARRWRGGLLETLIHRRLVSLKRSSDQSSSARFLRRLSTSVAHPSRMNRFSSRKPNADVRASIVRAWLWVRPERMAMPPSVTRRASAGART